MNSTYSLTPIIRSDTPNKSGLCPMYLRYTYLRQWKNISLNKTIDPTLWSKDDYEPRRNCPNRTEILDLIRRKKNDYEGLILNHYREYDDYPTPDELLTLISVGKTTKNWDYYYDLFVKNQVENKYVEVSTKEVYRQTKEKLTDFLLEKNIRWNWKNVNQNFYNDFVYFLRNNELKDSTIGKHIKTLKTFLKYVSTKFKLISLNEFTDFTTLKEETDFVILNENDIELMKSSVYLSSLIFNDEYNLSDEEKLYMRILIILCKTGMNICDLQDVKVSDFFVEKRLEDLINTNESGDSDNETIKNINLFIRKIRKKIKRVDVRLIPVIPITHEISDVFLLSFNGYEDIFKGGKYISRLSVFFKNEDVSISRLWSLISSLEEMSDDERLKLLPSYPFLLPRVQEVYFNRDIKKILGKIGLNYKVKIVQNIGQNKISELILQKNEGVSSRTGRRSFITNSIIKGIDKSIIMRITGIKKMETLQRYENISEQVIIEQSKVQNPKPQKK